MNTIHVGQGATVGALTVFPVWTAPTGLDAYTTSPHAVRVAEVEGGAQVERLRATNLADRPVLVLEGQLFEGGWQHRMALFSTLVEAGEAYDLEVACVEQGRWAGDREQFTRGRRGTPYVRDALRDAPEEAQHEVWHRVERRTVASRAEHGNDSGSLVHEMDRATDPVDVSRLPLLPGQNGVLVGLGGQPYALEVFSSAQVLLEQYEAVLGAAALDAVHVPAAARVPTPGRRARRFVARLERTVLQPEREAGLAVAYRARTERVDLAVLRWHEADLYTRASNLGHPMLVA